MRSFHDLKIKTKLICITILSVLGMFILALTPFLFLRSIDRQTKVITQEWLPSVIMTKELNIMATEYRLREYQHVTSTTQEEKDKYESVLLEIYNYMEQYMQKYESTYVTEGEQTLLQTVKANWTAYMAKHKEFMELSRAGDDAKASELFFACKPLFEDARNSLTALSDYNTQNATAASEASHAAYWGALKVMTLVFVLVIGTVVLLCVLLTRAIIKPITALDRVATKIAEGDLSATVEYHSGNELGRLADNLNKTVSRLKDYMDYINEISDVLHEIANGNLDFSLTYDYAGEFAKIKNALNLISDSLNDTMSNINQSADQVASGSEQVSTGAQALAQGATQQASSVEELAATVNTISENVKNNATSSMDATARANKLGQTIEQSNEHMRDMIESMAEINNSSSEIGKIIKLIEDIAFQTNILALNAAVEAARAGEAGKGFAVVADEVRSLAGKSAEAASNTTLLIENSIKAVENGTNIANDTAEILQNVVTEARGIIDSLNLISSASNEQATAIAQVTEGIEQISNVVQTNSSTSEQSAAASEELSEQAQVMKDLVSKFRLKGGVARKPVGFGAPQANISLDDDFGNDFDFSKY